MKASETNSTNVWSDNPWNLPYDLDYVNEVRTISLPDEYLWHDEKEIPRTKRVVRSLGNVATKAAGVTGNLAQLAPIYALAATSKAGEKIWQSVDIAAARLEGMGMEDAVWGVTTETGERIRQGTHKVTSYLGEAAIGETLRSFAITAANTTGNLAPLVPVHLWETTSTNREKLRNGTSKVIARLGEAAIGETIKNATSLESVRYKSTKKSAIHKENLESSLRSVSTRLNNIGDILTRNRPDTEDQINQSRQLAEKYKRLSSRALASGQYRNYKKYLKKAEQQQKIYRQSLR